MPDQPKRQQFKIKLTYFKASGKYYADGECNVEASAIVCGAGTSKEYTIAYTYDVIDAVALMDPHPGLSGRWTEGPILVTGPEMSPPHLITSMEEARHRAKHRRDTDLTVKRTEDMKGALGRSRWRDDAF